MELELEADLEMWQISATVCLRLRERIWLKCELPGDVIPLFPQCIQLIFVYGASHFPILVALTELYQSTARELKRKPHHLLLTNAIYTQLTSHD